MSTVLGNSQAVTNIFYNNTTVSLDVGCTIEYNMNSLIPGVKATYLTTLEDQYKKDPSGRLNLFKKLFPVDSIIKPFRPDNSGIKYFILLPNDTVAGSFSSYRSKEYPSNQPRIYYPGVTTFYKYWVSPVDQNADVTVTYRQATNPETGNKNALCNKIVLKFEKNHTLPTNYTITITNANDSTTIIGPISSVPADGIISHYYNGTNWNTTTEPVTFANPVSIKSINVTATNPGGGKVIGIIEVSARWVKDISSDILSLNLNQESSSDQEGIVPVGFVNSNSMDLSLAKYDQTQLKYVHYDKLSSSFNSELVYMVKNAELKPYFKVNHAQATYVNGSYDRINQGVYYIDSFSISQYGDTNLTALDGAKYLMETICPDILCEDYPVTAILRRLMDTVGFTKYNFNLRKNNQNEVIDNSIPQIAYWWSDDSSTVWQLVQELCRDIQMNAVFDENGVLQFYSREYLYNKSSIDWEFYHEKEGNKLPNIVSLESKYIPGANFVKVLWKTPILSEYVGGSDFLWNSGASFLTAGGLQAVDGGKEISETVKEIIVNTQTIDELNLQQSTFNFSGYFLIDSEIMEYDAVEYEYVPASQTSAPWVYTKVWITSPSDLNQYRYLSKPGYANLDDTKSAFFRPTGKYRIKTRGALGTTATTHNTTGSEISSAWSGKSVNW